MATVRHFVHDWMQCPPPASPAVRLAAEVSLPEPLQAPAPEDSSAASATACASFIGENPSDPNATGVAIYSNPQNLGTAFASIMNHAQNRADFHPADTSPEKLAAAFSAYVHQVDSTPFFHLTSNSQVKQQYDSSDYNKLIDQIGTLYDGLKAKDQDKIKSAITNMAKSVFGSSHAKQWKNLFSQTTLDMSNPTQPTFMLYYTSMYMSHDDNGKDGVESHQTYEVRKTSYVVLPEMIQAYATTLAGLDKKSVDDWMTGGTSPQKKDVKLCFTPKH